MSVARRSSTSPRRISRKSTSPNSKHAQNWITQGSPLRGRKPLPEPGINIHSEIRVQSTPRSPVRVNFQPYKTSHPVSYTAEVNGKESYNSRWISFGKGYQNKQPNKASLPPRIHLPTQHYTSVFSEEFDISGQGSLIAVNHPLEMNASEIRRSSPSTNRDAYGDTYHTHESPNIMEEMPEVEGVQPLQYHHIPHLANDLNVKSFSENRQARKPERLQLNAENSRQRLNPLAHARSGSGNLRPLSSHSEMGPRGRSPAGLGYIPPPSPSLRVSSAHSRHSLDNRSRPTSQLISSYPQSPTVSISLGESNTVLRSVVGSNASLLSTPQTLAMYRHNVSKSHDPATQYDFAMLLIETAQNAGIAHTQNSSSEELSKKSEAGRKGGARYSPNPDSNQTSPKELLDQARQILKNLSDRSYPLAQYYLADGYASGFFAKGKPDHEKAFPLFVAASKHGHAESGYRAALCYEYGWGCKKDAAKSFQFYRQSASKNHPGAMTRMGKTCIWGGLGPSKYREGLRWLKRAQESADIQYNAAPYYLGCLYENGYGDDLFQDEAYAAVLFTQAADLGHVEAAFRLGEAYEHGELSCPRDAALSVHFYTLAAQGNHLQAMMGLCAWYVVGAEPVMEIDHEEAFEWAMKAARQEYPAAEYAVGWFTEMGMGCRRDPLEANVWYIRAADHGDQRARVRLQAINGAASGEEINDEGKKNVKGNALSTSISFLRLNSMDSNSRKNTDTNPKIQASPLKQDNTKNDLNGYGLNANAKQNENLKVPGQSSSVGSNTPAAVSSGNRRFSLGESPQKPKRGVLRKTRVQGGVMVGDDEEDQVAVVGGVGDVDVKGRMLKDKEKKEKDKVGGWFSGLWN